jgi:hypothetical protein
MTCPPLLRTPAVRLLLVAYPALAGLLPAAGRPWLTVPLCLTALLATGALWIRALPGLPAETGVPAARAGLAAAAGLITVPLVALLLHAAGRPVRPMPLTVACAVLVTVLGAVAVVREHRAGRRAAAHSGLPAQRRHDPGSPRHAAGRPAGPAFPDPHPGYDRTTAPASPNLDMPPPSPAPESDISAASPAPDPDTPPASSASDPGASPASSSPDPGSSSASPSSDRGISPGSSSPDAGSERAEGHRLPEPRAGMSHSDLPGPGRGSARTTVAVAVPLVLAAGVGGPAVHACLTGPRPAEPGYLSVALNGWAAAIDSPVTVPAGGLVIPVRVTSAGLAETTSLLQLRVGGEVVASRPMTVAADSVRSLTVFVPALPPDGHLRSVAISVGATGIGFFARGHVDTSLSPRTTASAAVTGPGVRPHTPTGGGTATVPRNGSHPATSRGAPATSSDAPATSRGAPAAARVTRGSGTATRAPSARPGGDRAGRVRVSSAKPGADRAAGVRPAPVTTTTVRAPSAASAADGTATGTTPPVRATGLNDGAATGGTANADDHPRSGGTKGGRAVTGPARFAATVPGAAAAPEPHVPPGHGAVEPSRVACSGKRRAVFVGERTTC